MHSERFLFSLSRHTKPNLWGTIFVRSVSTLFSSPGSMKPEAKLQFPHKFVLFSSRHQSLAPLLHQQKRWISSDSLISLGLIAGALGLLRWSIYQEVSRLSRLKSKHSKATRIPLILSEDFRKTRIGHLNRELCLYSLFSQGAALAEKGDYDAAIAIYNAVLKQDIHHVGAHFSKGNALAKKGDYNAAISSYNEALTRDANHVGAHINKGNVLAKLGNSDAAAASYEDAADAYYNWGSYFWRLENDDFAFLAFDEVVRLKPNSVISELAALDQWAMQEYFTVASIRYYGPLDYDKTRQRLLKELGIGCLSSSAYGVASAFPAGLQVSDSNPSNSSSPSSLTK